MGRPLAPTRNAHTLSAGGGVHCCCHLEIADCRDRASGRGEQAIGGLLIRRADEAEGREQLARRRLAAVPAGQRLCPSCAHWRARRECRALSGRAACSARSRPRRTRRRRAPVLQEALDRARAIHGRHLVDDVRARDRGDHVGGRRRLCRDERVDVRALLAQCGEHVEQQVGFAHAGAVHPDQRACADVQSRCGRSVRRCARGFPCRSSPAADQHGARGSSRRVPMR